MDYGSKLSVEYSNIIKETTKELFPFSLSNPTYLLNEFFLTNITAFSVLRSVIQHAGSDESTKEA
jgi:hypothetical protein